MRVCSDVLKSAGCDWITCTTKQPEAIDSVVDFSAELLEEERLKGNFVRPWGMSGFEGAQCGSMQFGIRNEETIMRLSADLAQQFWRKAYALAKSVTRFDVQCTTHHPDNSLERIRRAFNEGRNWSRKASGRQRFKAVFGQRGPETIYCGSRQSDIFIRIYDKYAESGRPEWLDCLRFEIEFKGKRGLLVARQMLAHTDDFVTASRILPPYLLRRGISLEFNSDTLTPTEVPGRDSDRTRALGWLRSQVKPTVLALMRQGNPQEVVEALGLLEQPAAAAVRAQINSEEGDQPDGSVSSDYVC
jgi:DNA relaxase NicK